MGKYGGNFGRNYQTAQNTVLGKTKAFMVRKNWKGSIVRKTLSTKIIRFISKVKIFG